VKGAKARAYTRNGVAVLRAHSSFRWRAARPCRGGAIRQYIVDRRGLGTRTRNQIPEARDTSSSLRTPEREDLPRPLRHALPRSLRQHNHSVPRWNGRDTLHATWAKCKQVEDASLSALLAEKSSKTSTPAAPPPRPGTSLLGTGLTFIRRPVCAVGSN